jgi:hypothetical protein
MKNKNTKNKNIKILNSYFKKKNIFVKNRMNQTNKIFVLEPRAGLCNQLNCIAIGLVIGYIYNRKIYFHKFQLDYTDMNNLIDFESVINIDHLNKILKEYKINTSIIKNNELKKYNVDITEIDNIELLNTNNQLIYNIKNIFPFINSNDLNKQILNLQNPNNTIIPEIYKNFYNYIRINIRFNQKYIDIANKIIDNFELTNFCCIHLRLEDDAIEYVRNNKDYDYVNDIYKQIYVNELEILKKSGVKIYVCTSLGLFENKNNLFYKIIKKQYDLIDKNDVLQKLEKELNLDFDSNDVLQQREICGIIDYLIALKSDYFVGCDWSSFSILIKDNHEFYKKSFNLLKIWDIVYHL